MTHITTPCQPCYASTTLPISLIFNTILDGKDKLPTYPPLLCVDASYYVGMEIMRYLIIAAVLIAAGCGREPVPSPKQEESKPSVRAAPTPERSVPKSIGPQFWVYDLSSYAQVDSDVVSGMGGRWISVRYQKKDGADVSRENVMSNIVSSLEGDGWTKKALPGRKYVLSQIWEKSDQDLHFSRGAKEKEPENWFFSQTIHVSTNAETVCLYCEVGW